MIDIVTNIRGAPIPQFIAPHGYIEGIEPTTLFRPDTGPFLTNDQQTSLPTRSKAVSLKKSFKTVKELDDINECTIQSLKKAISRKS